jgi:tetratricopeptide (TPR) repeat protein
MNSIPHTKRSLRNSIYALFISCFAYSNASIAQNDSLANVYFNIANDYKVKAKSDSALIYYELAANEFKKLANFERLVDSYNQLGIVLTRQDKYEEAKKYLHDALQLGKLSLDKSHLSVATTYISLGVISNAEADFRGALEYHYKALGIRLEQLGEFHPEVATSYGNLGNVYRNNKEFDKSIDAHMKALKIREKVYGADGAEIIESYVGLGNAYREKKEYQISLEYFEKALKNKIIQRGEGHKDLARFYAYISDVYFLMDNKLKSEDYKLKSETLKKGKG